MSSRGSPGCPFVKGAGASPPFPPRYPSAVAAREALEHVVRREPKAFGLPNTRWTLDAIRQVGPWLRTTTRGSLANLLDRLGFSSQRAREPIHSPDPAYLAKLARIAVCVHRGRHAAGRVVTLYLDEFTDYRQPTLAPAWARRGAGQPRAERSQRSDTQTRVLGALNVADGRVHFHQASKLSVPTLVAFYQRLRAAYPAAGRLHVVQDNWPVHFHPDLLVALEPQTGRFAYHRPRNWPTAPSPAALAKWGPLRLPIQLVPLPTYASWANPIETLWRQVRQARLHLHRYADDLETLRRIVAAFLEQFAHGSDALLREVGLLYPQ